MVLRLNRRPSATTSDPSALVVRRGALLHQKRRAPWLSRPCAPPKPDAPEHRRTRRPRFGSQAARTGARPRHVPLTRFRVAELLRVRGRPGRDTRVDSVWFDLRARWWAYGRFKALVSATIFPNNERSRERRPGSRLHGGRRGRLGLGHRGRPRPGTTTIPPCPPRSCFERAPGPGSPARFGLRGGSTGGPRAWPDASPFVITWEPRSRPFRRRCGLLNPPAGAHSRSHGT